MPIGKDDENTLHRRVDGAIYKFPASPEYREYLRGLDEGIDEYPTLLRKCQAGVCECALQNGCSNGVDTSLFVTSGLRNMNHEARRFCSLLIYEPKNHDL